MFFSSSPRPRLNIIFKHSTLSTHFRHIYSNAKQRDIKKAKGAAARTGLALHRAQKAETSSTSLSTSKTRRSTTSTRCSGRRKTACSRWQSALWARARRRCHPAASRRLYFQSHLCSRLTGKSTPKGEVPAHEKKDIEGFLTPLNVAAAAGPPRRRGPAAAASWEDGAQRTRGVR
ncbi:hypothetical protein ISF_02592 [Cordyceps fumosorosea ARSEF 2679]|uniref:Uncharacterized protein n=1 Tax=Cordyceps fumosorosea (strain ARSEF 2679) TaxID=1081104 RepID=A0A168BW22_CORFA|nr:hypothetical protein ISF_02592 [Cordyceps fumosorosea ARSEF 2679]OAA70618.1 hypothetical protein ISF_02592 [Cordyceps fumosorosea ARSEF 2679]